MGVCRRRRGRFPFHLETIRKRPRSRRETSSENLVPCDLRFGSPASHLPELPLCFFLCVREFRSEAATLPSIALRVVGRGDKFEYVGDFMSEQSTPEESIIGKKLVLKPPVHREELLRFTEDDPERADEFLELLREFREDRQSRPEP